jgi:hypothetical protein
MDDMEFCNCLVPYYEGAGQHSPSCGIFQIDSLKAGNTPVEERFRCNVMSGDGSIPGAVCILPAGHFPSEHYG